MMVSDTTTFHSDEQFMLRRASQDFVAQATAVGASINYQVSGIDRKKRTVTLTKDAGLGMGVLIGEIKRVDVALQLEPDGRTVDMTISIMANFDKGNQAMETQIASDVKAAFERAAS
jgi:hypothetical protein